MKIANLDIEYPKSEKTIVKHHYLYKGIEFINDMGHPSEYRLEKDGKDLKTMVKYYGGRLLTEYGIS